MQEDDNMTREQLQEEIQRIKEAHAEDEGPLASTDYIIVLVVILL